MKIKIYMLSLLAAVLCVSCQDLSSLHEEVSYLDKRADAVNDWMEELSVKAEVLTEIIHAYQNKDYITDILVDYDENNQPVRYTVHFAVAEPVVIIVNGPPGNDGKEGADGADGSDGKPGKDGKDGSDGQDGTDGQDGLPGKDGADGKPGADGKDGKDGQPGPDGKDGSTPFISVGMLDGCYYWKADGEWILDESGGLVPVKAGIIPLFRIESDSLYVSFDNGTTWKPIEPLSYSFSGVVGVIQNNDSVSFKLADGSYVTIPFKNSVSFNLSKEGCLDAVAGATYTLTYTYTGTDDARVSLIANDHMGPCQVSQVAEGQRGTITYTISEESDISLQKLTVILNHSRGSIVRTLTFRRSGRLDVGNLEPVPAEGGECLVSVVSEGFSSLYTEVTSGGDWLVFSSTSSQGTIYQASPNSSPEARVAEITFTARSAYFTTLFTKKIYVVQFGNGGRPSYLEYPGDWTMTGKDRISGTDFTRHIRIRRNDDIPGTYLIYGLSPHTGESLPVLAKYEESTGKMKLMLHQECLSATESGLYAVSLSGNDPVKIQSGRSFTFTVNKNTMTADMSYDHSFMFMSSDGKVLPQDKVFYHDVNLSRDGLTRSYADGEVVMLNKASSGHIPLNIVILGDGYQAKDMRVGGKFERSARGTMDSFFAVEPFKSFKNRFDVYMVPFMSVDEGTDVTSSGIQRDTYFSSVCAGGNNTLVTCNYDKVLEAVNGLGLTKQNYSLYRTVVILLVNTSEQSGSCWYIKDGKIDDSIVGDGYKSMAIAMLAANTTGTNGLIRHEAGGHGFGRLADEYNWGGTADDAKKANLLDQQTNYGFYWNVCASPGPESPWAHFVGLEGYEDVGYYEGAWGCSSGLYRPTENSIMLNNQGSFNAPSREIIYKRIILQSEGAGSYSFEKFLEYDKVNL